MPCCDLQSAFLCAPDGTPVIEIFDRATGAVTYHTLDGSGLWPGDPTTLASCDCVDDGISALFDPAAGETGGWLAQVSDPLEEATIGATSAHVEAGGFTDTTGTHYARIRYPLPENEGRPTEHAWCQSTVLDLPTDFWDGHEAYVRLVGTDNFTVASGPDEFRVGLAIFSDGTLNLVADHQNQGSIVLWSGPGSLLIPGQANTLSYTYEPGRAGDGSWSVTINGVVVGSASGVTTVPASVPVGEEVASRVYAGIDGASGQDNLRLVFDVNSISFSEKPCL